MQGSSNDENLSSSITQRMPWAIDTEGEEKEAQTTTTIVPLLPPKESPVMLSDGGWAGEHVDTRVTGQVHREINEEARQPSSLV